VVFEPGAIRRIAGIAKNVNEMTENIGARRLHTVLTTLLEEVLFEAPDGVAGRVTITEERVEERLRPILGNRDLSRFIL
jgi:ATP-dependent HslUV protease ATP-binding subunit HslU